VKDFAPDQFAVAGLLLAGGHSTRMGRDKAQLDWRGTPLGDRQAATLSAAVLKTAAATAGTARLFLSCRPDQAWTPASFERLEDRTTDGGVLAALVDALTITSTHAAVTIVLAIDLPQVRPGMLAAFATQAAEGQVSLITSHEDRFEPLAGAWHRSALPVLRETLAHDRSLQAACATLFKKKMLLAYRLTDAEARSTANVNTPADVARVVRLQ